MTTTATPTQTEGETITAEAVTADAFAARVFTAALGWAESMSIYLGDRLGWYRSLVDDGSATADELAARTGTSPRYAREWLEQQAVIGILVADPDPPDTTRPTPTRPTPTRPRRWRPAPPPLKPPVDDSPSRLARLRC